MFSRAIKAVRKIGGNTKRIIGIVVVRATVRIDIAEIVAVARIWRPTPPIRRRRQILQRRTPRNGSRRFLALFDDARKQGGFLVDKFAERLRHAFEPPRRIVLFDGLPAFCLETALGVEHHHVVAMGEMDVERHQRRTGFEQMCFP